MLGRNRSNLPSGGGPNAPGQPLYNNALNSPFNTHQQQPQHLVPPHIMPYQQQQQQQAIRTPPPRLPGTYPQSLNTSPNAPLHLGHVSRPSMAQFVPNSMPPMGFPSMPGALMNNYGMQMQMPMPMTMPMPMPMQGGPYQPASGQFQPSGAPLPLAGGPFQSSGPHFQASPHLTHGHGRTASQMSMPHIGGIGHARSPSQMPMPTIGHARSPSQMPMPNIGHARSPSQMPMSELGQPGGSQFKPRSKRQPSIGGPPKAVLGGPAARRGSVMPIVPVPAPMGLLRMQEPKRIIPIRIPLESDIETVEGEIKEDGEPSTEEGKASRTRLKSLWFRPAAVTQAEWLEKDVEVPPPQSRSCHALPPDGDAVFPYKVVLPLRDAWGRYKQNMVEEKLSELAYTNPGLQNHPFVPGLLLNAPLHGHARAFSMASTFDPGLLHYKLSKLAPPDLPLPSSISPPPPGLHNAQPGPSNYIHNPRPTHHSSLSLNVGAQEFYPRFGTQRITEEAEEEQEEAEEQGRLPVPVVQNQEGYLHVAMNGEPEIEKPKDALDFVRGFGLDVLSESEAEEEEGAGMGGDAIVNEAEGELEADQSGLSVYHEAMLNPSASEFSTAPLGTTSLPRSSVPPESEDVGTEHVEEESEGGDGDREEEGDSADDDENEDMRTLAAHSRHPTATNIHHASNGSAARPTHHFAHHSGDSLLNESDPERAFQEAALDMYRAHRKAEAEARAQNRGEGQEEEEEEEEGGVLGAEDWTGSEDARTGEEELEDVGSEDDMSESMFSNPSDEERVRQERLHRRMVRAQRAREPRRARSYAPPTASAAYMDEPSSPRRLPPFPQPPNHPPFSAADTDRVYLPTQRSEATTSEQDQDTSELYSNPSEEGERHFAAPEYESAAAAHSHHGSAHSVYPTAFQIPLILPSRSMQGSRQGSISLSATGSVLNPQAKPFVFGTGSRPGSFSGASPFNPSFGPAPVPPPAPPSMHGRQGSIGGRLNAQAAEFRPSFSGFLPQSASAPSLGFNFRAPQLAPVLNFSPQAESTRVFSQGHTQHVSAATADESERPVQGREKRQRQIDDDAGREDISPVEDGRKQRLASFQFPPARASSEALPSEPSNDRSQERSQSLNALNAAAQPFVFDPPQPLFARTTPGSTSSVSGDVPPIGQVSAAAPPAPASDALHADDKVLGDVPLSPTAPSMSDRISIPEWLKHPVSTKTVPASLFKSLNSYGDGEGRRSRFSSRDQGTKPFVHSQRPSEEDEAVHASSSKPTTPAMDGASDRDPYDDLPVTPSPMSPTPDMRRLQQHTLPRPSTTLHAPSTMHRSSSMPLLRSESPSNVSQHATPEINVDAVLPTPVEDLTNLGRRLEEKLEEKFELVRKDLTSALAESKALVAGALDDKAIETIVDRVVSSLESRLKEPLSPVNPQNDLEPEGMLNPDDSMKDAEGDLDFDLLRAIVTDSHEALRDHVQSGLSTLSDQLLEEMRSGHRVNSVNAELIEGVSSRTVEAVVTATSGVKQLLDNLNDLSLARSDADRERLLSSLSDLVLPQIASLRVEPLDVDLITERLAEAVKPHISQLIDLASDKKETAALIVQRLGPLLSSLMPPPMDIPAITQQIAAYIERLMPPPINTEALKEDIVEAIANTTRVQLDATHSLFDADVLASKVKDAIHPLIDLKDVAPAAGTFDSLLARQEALHAQSSDLLAQNATVASELSSLPNTLVTALDTLKAAQDGFVANSRALEDLRELQQTVLTSADFQSRLNAAEMALQELRAEKMAGDTALLSLRSERDAISDERDTLRSERDGLRTQSNRQLDELAESQLKLKNFEESLERTNTELESARLASSGHQEQVSSLEAAKTELEKSVTTLAAQVSRLETESLLVTKDLETALASVQRLEKERDEMAGQQQHWEVIQRTADQVETLTQLMNAADNEEVKELKRVRDRSKVMEGEYASLKKRFEDQESKLANLQRTAISSKQGIAQAQQRASESEKKARLAESELASFRAERETGESLRRQLETDFGMLQQRHEELERLEGESRGRETHLQNDLEDLRQQLGFYKAQAEEARAAAEQAMKRPVMNGNARTYSSPTPYNTQPQPSRPTSTAPYEARQPSRNPTPRLGTWQSMHAPTEEEYVEPGTPRAPSYGFQLPYGQLPYGTIPTQRSASPALSTISAAPTEQEDGWWS